MPVLLNFFGCCLRGRAEYHNTWAQFLLKTSSFTGTAGHVIVLGGSWAVGL